MKEESIVSMIDREAEDFLIPAYFVTKPTIEGEKIDFEELKSIYIAGRSKSIESFAAKDERIKELENEIIRIRNINEENIKIAQEQNKLIQRLKANNK